MEIKKNIHKAAVAGIGMTVIATLLSGCLGGSGTAATPAAAATTTTTITPFKGRFGSGSVKLFDADNLAVTLTSGGTINASGVASVTYAKTAKYPLRAHVTGTYYNEQTKANETSATAIRGFIKDLVTAESHAGAASGIPVTAVTEIAVASLASQTGLTGASAIGAITTAETLLGLAAGDADKTPVFNADGTTADAATLKLAALSLSAATNGTGADLAAKIANLATTLATLNSASAPTAVPALANLAAAVTSITSGASSILPASTVAPAITAFAVPASSVAAIQSAVAATTATITTNTAALASFTTDLTTGGGVRHFQPGWSDPFMTQKPQGNLATATLANAVYTVTWVAKELANNLWAAVTGTTNQYYVLGNAGWLNQNATGTATASLNADGSVRFTEEGFGTHNETVQKIDLSGKLIASEVNAGMTGLDASGNSTSLASSVISATATFPAGSFKYVPATAGQLASQDIYEVGNSIWNQVIGANGAQLTALPTTAPYCLAGAGVRVEASGVGAALYSVQTMVTNASMVQTVQCPPAASGVLAATATGATKTVNGVQIAQLTAVTPVPGMFTSLGVGNFIAVLPDGKAYGGSMTAKGSVYYFGGGNKYNKTAMDAAMTAAGLPKF